MNISFTLTKDAAEMLYNIGIDPLSYGPAYDGESVGLDLYNTGPEITLQTHHVWTAYGEKPTMVPTGVHIALPPNTVALIKERGSITKTGLISRAGVIDPGYTGEIFVNLVNIGSKKVTIEHSAKLPVQLVVIPCFTSFSAVGTKEYLEITQNSKRANRSLGSSDNL